jgi:hypothetical protein
MGSAHWIWRRLLVPGGARIAGLHAIVQAAFGWSGEHLHYFNWRLDLRVEQITDARSARVYPRCTGGRRAGPPEDWAGPWELPAADPAVSGG